jgi:hypothetical protein
MNVAHFIIGFRQNGSYQLVKNISQMQSLQRSRNCVSVILLLFPLITSITTHTIQLLLSVYKMRAICQENMALDNV